MRLKEFYSLNQRKLLLFAMFALYQISIIVIGMAELPIQLVLFDTIISFPALFILYPISFLGKGFIFYVFFALVNTWWFYTISCYISDLTENTKSLIKYLKINWTKTLFFTVYILPMIMLIDPLVLITIFGILMSLEITVANSFAMILNFIVITLMTYLLSSYLYAQYKNSGKPFLVFTLFIGIVISLFLLVVLIFSYLIS